ncbi:MAG: hypothetical protein MUE53_00745 [Chitinophagales bacterium]|jgi:ADP-heptose:LPS heptosyltransferase|nr:hypothetical protein [Chitinophagales bacterium]
MKSIALYRLSAFGDIAMITPLILGLLEENPDLRILFVTHPKAKVWLSDIPRLTIYPLEKKNFYRSLFDLYKTLKLHQVTHFFDLHASIRSFVLRILLKISSQIKIGVYQKDRKTEKLIIAQDYPGKEIINIFLIWDKLLLNFGYRSNSDQARFLAKEMSSSMNIGINPLSLVPSRSLSVDKCAEILSLIAIKFPQSNIYLFAQNIDYVTSLQAACPDKNNLIFLNQMPFESELKIIKSLSIMISVDSFLGHLAAIHDIPTITLWGVTHYRMGFKPYLQPLANQIDLIEKYPFFPISKLGNLKDNTYNHILNEIDTNKIIQRIDEILFENYDKR